MSALSVAMVDVVLDDVPDDEPVASALANLLDEYDDWDWCDWDERGPSCRFAVLESTGAWWLVYRGTEDDRALRHASEDDAWADLRDRTS